MFPAIFVCEAAAEEATDHEAEHVGGTDPGHLAFLLAHQVKLRHQGGLVTYQTYRRGRRKRSRVPLNIDYFLFQSFIHFIIECVQLFWVIANNRKS